MVDDSNYPDFFARFYDVIYKDLRTDDQDYFLSKIKLAKGPVLEIGTGTGRFFIEALKSGADIYGVDISPAMLDILKNKIPQKDYFRVRVDDIRKMKLEKEFGLILAPFRVFQHLKTTDEQIQALNNVYNHLQSGGQFIFDLFAPNIKMLHEGLQNVKDFEGEYEPGRKIQRFTSMHADIVNQISHVTFKIVWDEGGEEKTEEWKTSLRFFFKNELELLIQASKFEKYAIYGDFKENKLTENSKELIVVCNKF